MLMGQSQVHTRSWVWAELGQQRKSHRERTTAGSVCMSPAHCWQSLSHLVAQATTALSMRWAQGRSQQHSSWSSLQRSAGLGAAVGTELYLLPGVLSLRDLMPGWASLCSAQELCILSFEGEFPSLSYACYPGDNSFLRSCGLVCRQASGEHHLPSGNDALLAQFGWPSVSLNTESLNKHYYKENFKHLFPCVV